MITDFLAGNATNEENLKSIIKTVVFTDLPNYSKLMADNSIKTLQLLAQIRKFQREIVFKFSGRIIKYVGDSTLIIFDSKKDAVSFCNIVNEKYNLNCGVAEGLIYVFGNFDDIFGPSVNLASRLGEDVARDGEIIIK